MHSKFPVKKTVILCGWLLIWQAAAYLARNPLFFPGPAEVIIELLAKMQEAAFWQAILASYIRILAGLFCAVLLAYPAAFLSRRFKLFEELIAPPVAFIRSVPVAAVVVILLIWSGASYLVYYITFMVVFPNVYGNLLTGLKKTDEKMLEMAEVYHMPFLRKLRCIYRPAYLPYLKSAMTFSVGMSFKSGVAAEIIGLPDRSIGTGIYMDKIYINTAGVFAWVIVILLAGFITEKLVLGAISLFPMPRVKQTKVPCDSAEPKALCAGGISKAIDGRSILDNVNMEITPGERVCLMGGSGIGKTTLLRILSGLVKADEGKVNIQRTALCFQEDRLWEDADAAVNLWMAGCVGDLRKEISCLLSEKTLDTPVKDLSGGERRRVAVARAMLFPSQQILLDEPFAGLDKDTKLTLIRFILEKQNGRPLLLVTHDEEDAGYLKAKTICLM